MDFHPCYFAPAVIVDAENDCHDVNFDIGSGSTVDRQWDIKGESFSQLD